VDNVTAHCAAYDDDTPANTVLQLHVNVSLSRPKRCVAHLVVHRTGGSTSYETNDSARPTGDLWRRVLAVDRGHGCATTRRSSSPLRDCACCECITRHRLTHVSARAFQFAIRIDSIRFVMRIDLNRFVL